jgi:hypothetical protein
MKKVIEIDSYDNFKTTIRGKLTTALEMFEFSIKTNTEQETEGELDSLIGKIREYLGEHDYLFHLNITYFKGMDDIIYEISFNIIPLRDKEIKYPIDSDQIIGETINQIYKHFGWRYYDKPVFRANEQYNDNLKKLLVFSDRP